MPRFRSRSGSRSRRGHSCNSSNSSDGEQSKQNDQFHKPVEEPILIYHESARSIVFRDHLRRAVRQSSTASSGELEDTKHSSTSSTTDTTSTTNTNTATTTSQQQQQQHLPKDSSVGIVNEVQEYTNLATELIEGVTPSQAGIPATQIAGFQPKIVPLPALEFGPGDEYQELLASSHTTDNSSNDGFTEAEQDVCRMLHEQHCTVKTIKNVDWTDFLTRFREPHRARGNRRSPAQHDDIPASAVNTDNENNDNDSDNTTVTYPFNSFVTSTSLLPPDGKRMRCFGSPNQYTTGVVFGLPEYCGDTDADAAMEDEATARTQTWSWPPGYSAKTEFNIDGRGLLINGRQEAICPLSVLRQYNDDYLNKDEYMVANRMVSGLSQIPYNEVFLRVGGLGRLVNDSRDDCAATGTTADRTRPTRSFDRGCGLPVALFVRTATFGHLITLLRTRARLMHVLGEEHIKGIPLLYISPDLGVRVLTESLQRNLWKLASSSLTPFQNTTIAHKMTFENTDESSFRQKVDELIEFDDSIREILTPEELARLAGGFGATDDSVATVLQQVMLQDKKLNRQHKLEQEDNEQADGKPAPVCKESHKLQDVVNEGLAAAVRSGDYHTSRQLLLLYSLVASQADNLDDDDDEESAEDVPTAEVVEEKVDKSKKPAIVKKQTSVGMGQDAELMKKRDLELFKKAKEGTLSTALRAQPPPPPLDTDRLRSATNCDGLLAVLGAAEVLKAMQDGGGKKRAYEVVSSLEEWVNYGEQSMAFRISSWYDQRAAQGDLKIATENDSKFMAFVSNKAISNRKTFAQQLRDAVENTDFSNVRFLIAINEILGKMHSPCLRLELLQYVLGLDNRYSLAHVLRSVELAASCLNISASATNR